jgi:hypothetical protein
MRTTWIVAALIAVAGIIGIVILVRASAGEPTEPSPELAPAGPRNGTPVIDGISCDRTEQVLFHIHADLAVYQYGVPRIVPFGIGIGKPWQIQQTNEGPFVASGSCFYWLHTHTDDGIIHIESPEARDFTLGNFFDVWQQPLSATQVGPAQDQVFAYVNGQRVDGNPADIVLAPHEVIQLNIGSDTPIPQPFNFPPGL